MKRSRRIGKGRQNGSVGFRWSKEDEAFLGKYPDTEVAEILNRSLAAVRLRRSKLGIYFKKPKKTKAWLPEELALLGKFYDSQVARLTGRPLSAVQKERISRGILPLTLQLPPWKPEEDALLGTMPDSHVAKLVGRTKEAAKTRRKHLEIPGWNVLK